jgi:hypothetical protein
MTFKDIWAKLHSKDLYTWIGHGVLGVGLGFVFGWVFVAGWFVGREVSDFVKWLFSDKATRRPVQEAVKDGFFDLWAPLAGAALAEILKAL